MLHQVLCKQWLISCAFSCENYRTSENESHSVTGDTIHYLLRMRSCQEAGNVDDGDNLSRVMMQFGVNKTVQQMVFSQPIYSDFM